MWFKNIQLFQLMEPLPFISDALSDELEQMVFSACLPNHALSYGWVEPVDDCDSLVYDANDCIMICLQIEEKILPPVIVNQKLADKIKKIETEQQRKIMGEEKRLLKNSIYTTLLPQAFGRKTKIYAYFDVKNNWLILDTITEKKAKIFLDAFKKALPTIILAPPKIKKIAPVMTHWLQHNSQPDSFEIGKMCIFQDPSQQSRIIRCQQQDLSASSILALIKDRFEVTQLELNWQDQLIFNLECDFTFRSLKFQDQVIELASDAITKNAASRFDADFVIMTEILSKLITLLLKNFVTNKG